MRSNKYDMGNELYVISKAKDLGNYIFVITDKSPKKFRFTLVSKIQNLSLSVIENLYRANFVYVRNEKDNERIIQRKTYQREAYVSLKLLAYMSWMAREQQCILPRQFEQISKQIYEVNRLLIGWAKSDREWETRPAS